MLSEEQKAEIQICVSQALDKSERDWEEHGEVLSKRVIAMDEGVEIRKSEIQPSRIPSHPFVNGDAPKVDDFIALVADMRNSTEHLQTVIRTAKISNLQRVYYEPSALLPALETTIAYKNGAVTEYLGDGVLALFKVNDDEKVLAIKNAYHAARNCVEDTRAIVNNELAERYNLPPLDIGIGLAYSSALVSLVGVNGYRYPKVIGECVYRATKLSAEKNLIVVDAAIHNTWPGQKGGTIKFRPIKTRRGHDGFAAHLQ